MHLPSSLKDLLPKLQSVAGRDRIDAGRRGQLPAEVHLKSAATPQNRARQGLGWLGTGASWNGGGPEVRRALRPNEDEAHCALRSVQGPGDR